MPCVLRQVCNLFEPSALGQWGLFIAERAHYVICK